MNLKVSVIIPTYNYARFIEQAIESVLAQTHPNIEIIVVDDGSTDHTEEVLAKFGDKIKSIKQQNKGVGAARNNGVKVSDGAFVAFLDADDIWLPNKIERQLQVFQNDEEVGLVSVGMREFDKEGKTISLYLDGKNGWCAEKLLVLSPMNVSGSAITLRRNAFERVGGFDEMKELHPSEDWEFCYRVAREFKFHFIPELLVDYRNHGNNGHLNVPRTERAMLLAYKKIFKDNSPQVQKLKRTAYGNLHKVLAGSYFHSKDYASFAKNSFKSLYHKPKIFSYFLSFPIRFWKRQTAKTQ